MLALIAFKPSEPSSSNEICCNTKEHPVLRESVSMDAMKLRPEKLMANNRQLKDAVFSLRDAKRILHARKSPDFPICLIGNALLCVLVASPWQFAILNILCLATVAVRYAGRTAGQDEERDAANLSARRAFLIFLLHMLIACDVAAAFIDSFSSNAII
ncbi:hypothetical protein [Rhizobium sp. BR 315]|uniref:hypothetical protein n=1 Tax=Rhizobium sp. BR 315 TaxID=3040014 RepID=UPI003D349833